MMAGVQTLTAPSACRSRTSKLGDSRSGLRDAKKEVDLRRCDEECRWLNTSRLEAPSIPDTHQKTHTHDLGCGTLVDSNVFHEDKVASVRKLRLASE